MMRIRESFTLLAIFGLLVAISGMAQANSIYSFESASTDASLTYPAEDAQDDVLSGLIPTSSVDEATFLVGSLARLTDNTASDIAGGVDERVIPADSEAALVLTYALGEALDINEIRLYTNNTDTRVGQSYDVAYSTDGVNYLPIIAGVTQLYHEGNGNDCRMSRVVDDGGASLASAATHLQFTLYPVRQYNDGQVGDEPWNGHASLYEIDAFGTEPTNVPEPSVLVILGTGLLGLALRRWQR